MRRVFITHPSFQYKFTLTFVAGGAVIVALIGGAGALTLFLASQSAVLSSAESAQLLLGARRLLMASFWIILAVAPAFFAVGILLSYRMVGPLARLERWLEQCLVKKSFSPFSARPGDELTPIVARLSSIVERAWGGR